MSQPLHIRLHEWEGLDPEQPAGAPLRDWRLEPRDRALAAQLAACGALELLELRRGLRVRAFSWVGRVRIGDLVVTIEPKLDPKDLLALLRYAYGLRDLRLWASAPYGTAGSLLQDLLAAQLLAEVRELFGRGLARRYVALEEELSVPRGRIDLAALAKRGPPSRMTLPCRHHPRSSDHHLNRLLLAGVRLGGRLAEDMRLRGSLRRLASQMEEDVSDIPLSAVALERGARELNRLVAAYRPALALTRLLHECSALSLDESAQAVVPGFLFNMNRFFQALVGRLLREHLSEAAVEEEPVLAGIIRYAPGANPRRKRAPAPRPDFMVYAGRRRLPLDAKYRDLWENDLPREMLYQLALYAVSQPAPSTAAIIYPTQSAAATEAQLELDVAGAGRAVVALRPLRLDRLVELLGEDRAAEQRAQLVRQLAFGDRASASLLAG